MATPSKGVTKRENRERERALREHVAEKLWQSADALSEQDAGGHALAITLLRDESERWRRDA